MRPSSYRRKGAAPRPMSGQAPPRGGSARPDRCLDSCPTRRDQTGVRTGVPPDRKDAQPAKPRDGQTGDAAGGSRDWTDVQTGNHRGEGQRDQTDVQTAARHAATRPMSGQACPPDRRDAQPADHAMVKQAATREMKKTRPEMTARTKPNLNIASKLTAVPRPDRCLEDSTQHRDLTKVWTGAGKRARD